jgi:glutaconate CoA-transferase, subunit A
MAEVSLKDLVAHIPDGAYLAIPTSRSGVAMAATRALIAHGMHDLHLVTIPTAGIQADMLIGAGCVATAETAGITLDEQGQAGRFVAAVKNGSINLMDTTCPAIVSGLQAGEKGVPFFPMRGLIGSDLLKNRPDYRVIDNPMAKGGDPIVVLPAIVPDVALFHAPLADRFGNVWIGKMRELMTMAHAAKHTLVTVEAIFEGDLMQDKLRAPATIPEMFISKVAIAKSGAWPLGLEGEYAPDEDALAAYAKAARNSQDFAQFMTENSDMAAE